MTLLHELIGSCAATTPAAEALRVDEATLDYASLQGAVSGLADALVANGLERLERIAVYLPKQVEAVVSIYGASAAGLVFVPVNPALKPRQVGHILRDCNVRLLVTSGARLASLAGEIEHCSDLHTVVLVDGEAAEATLPARTRILPWQRFIEEADGRSRRHRCIDSDVAGILYTSGSTGNPKGVVLSHRNMVLGARSVAGYLGNRADDRILAVLPLSFDYGLNQLSTAFLCGATVVLMDYLLPQDIIRQVERHAITGLAGVPTIWVQLARAKWPEVAVSSLRYLTNSGGAMPRSVTQALREALPRTRLFLMYGLTEAFRSTYLPPDEVDSRPESIGHAIPGAEVLVLREDGSRCAPGEPGELVHRGGLVALGYWNDPARTAERFRPVPAEPLGLPLPELAVWSGDTVRADEEGYLYFVGRRDDMIKTSGYRVSPTEVEEALYSSGLVSEAAAVGIPDPALGQAVVAFVQFPAGPQEERLLEHCRRELPSYMVPRRLVVSLDNLPRNPNGKVDRRALAASLEDHDGPGGHE